MMEDLAAQLGASFQAGRLKEVMETVSAMDVSDVQDAQLFRLAGEASIAQELQLTEDVLARHRPTPSPYILRLPGGMGWREPRIHAAIKAWNDQSVLIHWNIDPRDHEAPMHFIDDDDVELEARLRILNMVLDPLFSAPILLTHDNLASSARKSPAFCIRFFGELVDTLQSLGMTFGPVTPTKSGP